MEMQITRYKSHETPQTINKLVYNLLNVNNNESVLDIGSGVGSFLDYSYTNNETLDLFGIDIDSEVVGISKILLKDKAKIVLGDAFKEQKLLSGKDKYDKIFSNFTFGIRTNQLYETLIENDLPLSSRSTSDYYFINLLFRNLKETGKGIIITSGHALRNRIDYDIRKHLVNNNMIEAIYELPNKLYTNTAIPVYLMILSYNNDFISFANLKDYYKEIGRSLNELDVDSILKNLSKETKKVSKEQIEENDYNLMPEINLIKKGSLDSSISLGEISEVYSGWQITRKQLDEKINKEGNSYLIQLSDMDEYNLLLNERYNIEDSFIERYKLFDGDILITAKKPIVDLLVVDTKDETIIPTGSFIVVRLNENYDPYYVVSFLKTHLGKDIIKMNQTGTVIKNLTTPNVKKILIPKLDIVHQRKIGEEFKEKIDSIKMLKGRIKRLETSIKRNKHFKQDL